MDFMAGIWASAVSQTHADPESGNIDAPELRDVRHGLFLIFGGITSLQHVIIPKLKELWWWLPLTLSEQRPDPEHFVSRHCDGWMQSLDGRNAGTNS
jgi:hypothetical protein